MISRPFWIALLAFCFAANAQATGLQRLSRMNVHFDCSKEMQDADALALIKSIGNSKEAATELSDYCYAQSEVYRNLAKEVELSGKIDVNYALVDRVINAVVLTVKFSTLSHQLLSEADANYSAPSAEDAQ